MKFRPLHDRVVIRRFEGEGKTKGGIINSRHRQGEAARGRGHRCRAWEPATKAASWFRSTRRATGSYLVNGPAPRSRSTAKTS